MRIVVVVAVVKKKLKEEMFNDFLEDCELVLKRTGTCFRHTVHLTCNDKAVRIYEYKYLF